MSAYDQLCRALECGDEAKMRRILARVLKPSVTAKDDHGNSTVHWAVVGDKPMPLREMLQRGANPRATNNWQDTALHWAAQLGRSRMCRLLIGAKVDVNIAGYRGDTPMHRAARYGHSDTLESLKAEGGRLDIPNASGFLPLHEAALAGQADAVETLIALGAKLSDVIPKTGDTALHLAARLGYGDVVTILQDAGGDLSATNKAGETPLQLRPANSPILQPKQRRSVSIANAQNRKSIV